MLDLMCDRISHFPFKISFYTQSKVYYQDYA